MQYSQYECHVAIKKCRISRELILTLLEWFFGPSPRLDNGFEKPRFKKPLKSQKSKVQVFFFGGGGYFIQMILNFIS